MKYEVDFADIFERVPEPIGVCDEEGWLHAMNAAARVLLQPMQNERQRLILTVRETVRQMRMTDSGEQEFYMADVQVEGAKRRNVSLSLLPLSAGGYRVAFEVNPSSAFPPNVRILEALVNVNRHLQLFKSPDKMVALFASSFAEVFPDYAFHFQIERPRGAPLIHQHEGWEVPPQTLDAGDGFELPHVPASNFVWTASERGYRIDLAAVSGESGFIQIERNEDKKFSVGEREGFETFAQQLAFSLSRLWQGDDFSLVAPIIDQLDVVVVVCDSRRRIRVSNRTFESLVYCDDVIGRDLLDFFSPSSQGALRAAAATVMAGGEAEPFDAAIVNGDGSGSSQVILTIQVAPNAAPGEGSAIGQGFIVTAQHSEMSLLELEERLNRAEHLMNLGQLATGVAHELKNPLTSILNYADYLLRKYEDSLFEAKDRERLRRIIDGVEHIDAFVQDLMTLARPGDVHSELVDLHSAIRESVAMCELELRNGGARLDLALINSHVGLYGITSQLTQVFVNLLTNAARAMEGDGGVIRVETAVSDETIVCRVIDNASGMSDETLIRVFEPFFTTRDGAGGTGLGLAIVHTIVKRHRGEISVDSELGAGTTFTLTFPRAQS